MGPGYGSVHLVFEHRTTCSSMQWGVRPSLHRCRRTATRQGRGRTARRCGWSTKRIGRRTRTRCPDCAIVLKPATIPGFWRLPVQRNWRDLFSPKRRGRPGPKGPSTELIAAIVEMKRMNPRIDLVVAYQPAYLAKSLVEPLNVIAFQSGTSAFWRFCRVQTALAAPSLVFCPRARTCSLHHRRGYALSSRARARSPQPGSARGLPLACEPENPARSSRPLVRYAG